MQNKLTPTVIGIDIGACTTKLAAVLRGTVDIITNQANLRETPSVVGFGNQERKIGQIGNVKRKTNFKNTVLSPHRYLGLSANNSMDVHELSYSPCQSKFEGQTLFFKVDVNGKQQNLTPQQVLASFMTHLYSIIKHNNLDEKMIIFSVPSFFTQIQKRAFLNSTQISGIRNTKLITQSEAIALSYINQKKIEMNTNKHILFIDFGYSKLSLNLTKFSQQIIDIAYEKCNKNIGCRNIDQKIFEHICQKIYKSKSINIQQNKKNSLTLIDAIQKQRKILSGINETQIHIESFIDNEDLTETLTRQSMISIAQSVFQDITSFLTNSKQELIKLNLPYDSVELIGGGSRIPKIIEIIQQVFQITPSRTINSNQIIAKGATLAAVQQSGIFKCQQYKIKSRIKYGIKAVWALAAINQPNKQSELTIIDFNTELPYTKSIKIQTTKQLTISLFSINQQNEASRKMCTIKCQIPFKGKNQINCTFKINEDSSVTLSSLKDNDGQDIKYDYALHQTLQSAQLQSYKAKQKQMSANDLLIIQSYEIKNSLLSHIYKQKQYLNKQDIKKYSDLKQIAQIQNYLNHISNEIQSHQFINANDYQSIKNTIDQHINQLDSFVKNKKSFVILYFQDLQQLKKYATQSIQQISQQFQNYKPAQQILQQLKQIENWANKALQASKTKQISELPLVSKEGIDQQYQKIRAKMNQIMNFQRVHQSPPRIQRQLPRHQHFEQHYDPKGPMYRSQIPFWQSQNTYYPSLYQMRQQADRQAQQRQRQRQSQQYEQSQRRAQQQRQALRKEQEQQQRFFNYDPFLMNRSRLYRSPNAKFWDRGREFW